VSDRLPPFPELPPPPPLSAGKPAWRRHWRRRRLALHGAAQGPLLAAAIRQLPPLLPPHTRLGLYWPLAGEADLRGLAEPLPARLALPAIRAGAAGRVLRYEAWDPKQPLVADACGIPAPAECPGAELSPGDLALLLVPALAFDGCGFRLGSGGGWYDRLRSDRAWRAVPAVIVAPGGCQVETLPRDPWDLPFDGWLSELGLEWFQPVEACADGSPAGA